MKKEVSIDSRIYLPPKAWVVEFYSERLICVVSANSSVDEIDNRNDDGDEEDFDIHF